ncbi:UNVERIFIED_CONTAM: hypothetical protein HDU68_010070 [Siphonaria sp. JEL0065]|nr:hypothetical protein HDU68_010070 [Siphonaria sp. JEL0065]
MTTNLTDIPREVVVDIFAWVHPKLVAKFRLLSRNFNDCLTDKSFRALNISRCPSTYVSRLDEDPTLLLLILIPEWEVKLARLTKIELSGTNIGTLGPKASIPPGIKFLKKRLTSLSLISYIIYGEIPREVGSLVLLTSLELHDNRLSGTIPEELGLLQELRVLNLGGDNLSGKIPRNSQTLENLKFSTCQETISLVLFHQKFPILSISKACF